MSKSTLRQFQFLKKLNKLGWEWCYALMYFVFTDAYYRVDNFDKKK